jgi:predicted MFS family arabinose efflux permease
MPLDFMGPNQYPENAGTTSSHQRWPSLLLVWSAFFLTFCYRLLISNDSHPQIGGHLLQIDDIANLLTTFYVGYVALNFFAGSLADAFGPETILKAGLLGLGAAGYAFTIVNNVTLALLVQFAIGGFAGLVFAPSTLIIHKLYSGGDKARAIGFFMTATSIAIMTSGALVPAMQPFLSFQAINGIYASFALLIAVIALLLLPRIRVGMPRRATWQPWYLAIRDRNFLLISLIGFLSLWGSWGFILILPPLFQHSVGLSVQQVGTAISIIGAGSIIGKLVAGHLYARLSLPPSRQLAGLLWLSTLCVILVLFVHGSVVFYVWAAVTGVIIFSYITPLNTLLLKNTESVGGRGPGIANAVWQLGSAASPFVASHLYVVSQRTETAVIAIAAGPAAGALLTHFLSHDRSK